MLGLEVPTEMPLEGLEILAAAQAKMFLDVCTSGARRGLDAKRLRKHEWSGKMKEHGARCRSREKDSKAERERVGERGHVIMMKHAKNVWMRDNVGDDAIFLWY